MEWIALQDKEPEPSYFYDVWVKSTEKADYGRRITDILYDHGNFYTRELLMSMEYVSHYMRTYAPPTPKGEK